MDKLTLAPDQSGYSIEYYSGIVVTELEGGPPKIRRTFAGGYDTVNVTWTTDKDGFVYLKAFYNKNKASAFLIDLLIDRDVLKEHRAYWKAYQLNAIQGLTYTVSGTLMVKPSPVNTEFDAAVIELYNEFGQNWTFDEELINEMIN